MVNQEKKKLAKPLEIIDSKTYNFIIDTLSEKQNIHSYDVEVFATEEETGLTITIKYGENYSHSKEAFFKYDTLKTFGDDFVNYIEELSEECKKVMIADYYKMMKP